MASNTSAGLDDSTIEDTRSLGLLLSFLSPSYKITHDFLLRGGSPRKRWTPDGGIEEVDAITAGLSPELTGLLSDPPRLSNALRALSTTVLKTSDQAYILDAEAAKRIHQDLSTEALASWKTQALIVAYRAFSWKYIEARNFDASLITPHFHDTVSDYGMETFCGFSGGCRDASSAQSLLHRLQGDHAAAVSTIDTLIHQQPPNPQSRRTNAAMGHLTLQRALNCVQVDDLPRAEQLLEEWHALGDEPSLMEKVVQFRRGVTLARILRTRGRFSEAHTHLKRSHGLAEHLQDLSFDEDRRDLICEMADTLRELDKPEAAEAYLRKEFARRGEGTQDPPASGKSLLEASLAELLFAQGRIQEAERVCTGAESRADNLMKLGKLRICIVLAKIHHTRSEHEGALRYWDEAMRQVGKFPGTTGRTIRTIVLSRRENMRSLGLTDTRDQVLQHTASSDALGTPGGMVYWIPGMRHWQDYLDSEATWSRM
ncbi:NB-ARC domain [Diaporthe eres]|nr:NB-ARC domain [Diaporthe eres]